MRRASTTPNGSAPNPTMGTVPAFDGYPYLVTRIGNSALRHIAVLPATWPRERLLDLARRQVAANRIDTCLALAAGDAIYVTADGVEEQATHVPTGLPVIDRLRLAAALPTTSELEGRRARLRTYTAAASSTGYIVGDGLEAGRPARAADLVRLRGNDDDDPHPRLVWCATCGDLAGDFLANDGEGNGDMTARVIRVHCRCENHNRCAWCGDHLADHRLSAYYFIEATAQVCYVAAYSSFSHRCAERGT